jgi:pectin methylesterase-like acyl-CoA thioesterase
LLYKPREALLALRRAEWNKTRSNVERSSERLHFENRYIEGEVDFICGVP